MSRPDESVRLPQNTRIIPVPGSVNYLRYFVGNVNQYTKTVESPSLFNSRTLSLVHSGAIR